MQVPILASMKNSNGSDPASTDGLASKKMKNQGVLDAAYFLIRQLYELLRGSLGTSDEQEEILYDGFYTMRDLKQHFGLSKTKAQHFMTSGSFYVLDISAHGDGLRIQRVASKKSVHDFFRGRLSSPTGS